MLAARWTNNLRDVGPSCTSFFNNSRFVATTITLPSLRTSAYRGTYSSTSVLYFFAQTNGSRSRSSRLHTSCTNGSSRDGTIFTDWRTRKPLQSTSSSSIWTPVAWYGIGASSYNTKSTPPPVQHPGTAVDVEEVMKSEKENCKVWEQKLRERGIDLATIEADRKKAGIEHTADKKTLFIIHRYTTCASSAPIHNIYSRTRHDLWNNNINILQHNTIHPTWDTHNPHDAHSNNTLHTRIPHQANHNPPSSTPYTSNVHTYLHDHPPYTLLDSTLHIHSHIFFVFFSIEAGLAALELKMKEQPDAVRFACPVCTKPNVLIVDRCTACNFPLR